MKTRTLSALTMTLLLGLSPVSLRAADKSDDRDEFERRARQINRTIDEPSEMKQAIHHISVETGVSRDRVQAQYRRNPDLGAAGLLVANVMSAETKKEPEQFIRQHLDGKSWKSIATQNDVPLDKLNVRLKNLEKAVDDDSEDRN
jgi:hypothetical protein